MNAQSPIEIPELLDLILLHLPRSDRWKCVRVSQAWHRALVPFLYSRICVKPLQRDAVNSTDSILAGIARYGHLVRTLTLGWYFFISVDYLGEKGSRVVDALASYCSHLSVLSIETTGSSEHSSLSRLIGNNPGLIDVTYYQSKGNFRHHPDLYGLLTPDSSLQTLTLGLGTAPIPLRELERIGHRCPKLTTLRIDSPVGVYGNDATLAIQPSLSHSDDGNDRTIPAFPLLTTLIASRQSTDGLVHLLKECPQLHMLELYTVDIKEAKIVVKALAATTWCKPRLSFELCNSLNKWRFPPCPQGVDEAIQYLGICLAHKLNLQGIYGDLSTLGTIASHLGPRICSLELRSLYSVEEEGVLSILTACSGLENLYIDIWSDHSEPGMPHALDCHVLLSKPWVCLGLKTLGLAAAWPIDEMTPEEERIAVRESDEYKAMELLFYEQLSKLTQLRSYEFAWFEWSSNSYDDWITVAECFSWSLARGLDRLSTLKNLESLNFHDAVVVFGKAEQEWIKQNWPHFDISRLACEN